MKWIPKWLLSEWCVRLVILASGLYASFLYALRHLELISDSGREYEVYLTYVTNGFHTGIVDNMLVSCLWTTYLPSVFQRWLHFGDPSIVYRVVLAILISGLPLILYTLLRRYTSITISALMTVVLFTSFYFGESVYYARGQVALSLAIVLLILLLSNKWKWWLVSIIAGAGLAIAHYTTTYIYSGMLIGSGGLLCLCYLIKKRISQKGLALLVVGIALFGMAQWWYGQTYHGARTYAMGMLETVSKDIVDGNSFNPIPNHTEELITPSLPTDSIPANSPVTPPSSTDSIPANSLMTPSVSLGILIAKVLLLVQLSLLGIITYRIWKNGKLWSPEGVLLVGAILAIVLAVAIPRIDYWIGTLRVGYTLLPIQLMGISYWWGKNRDDRLLIPALALWAVIYH